MPADWVAGVDGCPGGWVAVSRRLDATEPPVLGLHARFDTVLTGAEAPAIVAVDMPIGLPERTGPGGRGPESLVRPLLGGRQSSVFSVPSRAAVEAGVGPDGYRAACAAALASSDPPRKVSKQCFHLFPKIRAIDRLLREQPSERLRVFESHPEVGFWRLNGAIALTHPKKIRGSANPAGLAERKALLMRHGFTAGFLDQPCPRGVGRDDLLDACVVAIIAERIAFGTAESFPAAPEVDAHGIRIAIWA